MHDSSEDGSDSDDGREKKGEVNKRKNELTVNERREGDDINSESDSDADRMRGRKKDTVKKGSRRNDSSEDNSDSADRRERKKSESDFDVDGARDRKKEIVKRHGHRYDTEDDNDSNRSDEKVEKGRRRGRRHDSDDDENSNWSHGRRSGKATTARERTARKLVSPSDDGDASPSDSDKDRRGHRSDDDSHGVRGSRRYQEGKDFASSAAKSDERKGRTLNKGDRLERLQTSGNNREMMKGKRKLDDEYHDEQPELKSRSRNLGMGSFLIFQ